MLQHCKKKKKTEMKGGDWVSTENREDVVNGNFMGSIFESSHPDCFFSLTNTHTHLISIAMFGNAYYSYSFCRIICILCRVCTFGKKAYNRTHCMECCFSKCNVLDLMFQRF